MAWNRARLGRFLVMTREAFGCVKAEFWDQQGEVFGKSLLDFE